MCPPLCCACCAVHVVLLLQAKLFDSATNQPVDRVTLGHALYALSFAANNKQLALGGVDNHLTVINL